MQCPKCKIETAMRSGEEYVTYVCRNPRCARFKQTVHTVKLERKREDVPQEEAVTAS